MGCLWGGTPPHATPVLPNAHVLVRRSESTPIRLDLPSAAGGSRRRHRACRSGWSHLRGFTCPTCNAEAARAAPVVSGQRTARKRAHHRLRAWPQPSTELWAREPRGRSLLLGRPSARAEEREPLARARAARQFEGATPRLGARARPRKPVELRRPVSVLPRRAQFGGNALCLGRRRRRGRLRLGGRRGTWRKPRAVGSPGSSTTSARPPRLEPAPGRLRTTLNLACRRPTAWRHSAAGWLFARMLSLSLLTLPRRGRLKQVAKGQLKTAKFTWRKLEGGTVAAPQQQAAVVEVDLREPSCSGAMRWRGGSLPRPRPQPDTSPGITSPNLGAASAGALAS